MRWLVLLVCGPVQTQNFFTEPGMLVGCFYDQAADRDLPFQTSLSTVTVKSCSTACAAHFYAYAGLQAGARCYCGGSFNKHGPGQCDTKCRASQNETCGGSSSNSVFSTGFKGNTFCSSSSRKLSCLQCPAHPRMWSWCARPPPPCM